MKAYLSDRNEWPTSYSSELLLDTLLEDFTSAEIKDLDVWYGKHEMQEEVYTVSYKITTDDKFLQNMMRSVDALPARTEANLESVNGRSAEFFKTSVLYAQKADTKTLLRDKCHLQGNIRTEDTIECHG